MTSTDTIEAPTEEKSTPTGKQPVVVQIYDSSQSLYFSTRHRLVDKDVMQMRDIPGLSQVEAVPTHYWVTVNYGRAFDYKELVPQILLSLADILGVPVSQLEVTQERMLAGEHDVIPELVEEAKRLEYERRQAYVAQRLTWINEWVAGMRRTIRGHLVERRRLLREQKRMGWS